MARGELTGGARGLMEPRRRKTTTIETTGGPGDPIRSLLRKRMAGFMRFGIEAYCTAFWEAMADNPEAKLVIYKVSMGVASKLAEVSAGEQDPADMETWMLANWGDGAYQLQPLIAGKLYGPPSRVFRFGEHVDEGPKKVEQDTIDAELAAVAKRLGHVATIAKLKEMAEGDKPERRQGEGDEEMKPETLLTLIQAQMAPLTAMIQASEERARRAEERAEKMLDRMLDSRKEAAAGQAPLFAEILKTAVAKPETLSLLLNGNPPPESTWLDTIRDLAKEFGPAIQAVAAQIIERNQVATTAMVPQRVVAPTGNGGPVPAVPPRRSTPPEPRPTGAPTQEGDGSMPMPLNEEQTMAKDNLVEFIRGNDFDNAFAVLETFPGFMPVQGGAMPLGEFILTRIDPKVNARIYLPQFAMLVPEFKEIQQEALAFIQYIQKRLLADDEAAARETTRGADDHGE